MNYRKLTSNETAAFTNATTDQQHDNALAVYDLQIFNVAGVYYMAFTAKELAREAGLDINSIERLRFKNL